MSGRRWWWLGLVAVLLLGAGWAWRSGLLPGAAKQRATAGAVSPSAPSTAASPSPAANTEAAIELASSDVVAAKMAWLSQTLPVSGSLKAVNTAFVKARVAGELQRLEVREGQAVKAGQLIGQIDPTEARLRLRQAEEQASAARAQLQIAEQALANNQALVNQGFISRNALDTSVSNAAAARASLQAAQAAAELSRKSLSDSEIRAPIAGLVAQRLAQPGERVGVDARIVEIVDLSQLELEAAVAPEQVLQLRVGQTAQVSIDGLPAPLAARISRINPNAQSGSRAVLAYLSLPATPGLRQGLFARAQIELQRTDALVVPVSGVRLEQSSPYVLVLQDGQAQRQRVQTGVEGMASFGGPAEPAVQILAGLQPGALVLRASVGALREGTRLRLGAVAASTTAPATAAATGTTTAATTALTTAPAAAPGTAAAAQASASAPAAPKP